MADAKKCDITGEYYPVEEADNQEFLIMRKGEEEPLDIGPKTYETLSKILNKEKAKKQTNNKSEKKYNLSNKSRERMRVAAIERTDLARKIREENPSFTWTGAIREAIKVINEAKAKKDNKYIEKEQKEKKNRPKSTTPRKVRWERAIHAVIKGKDPAEVLKKNEFYVTDSQIKALNEVVNERKTKRKSDNDYMEKTREEIKEDKPKQWEELCSVCGINKVENPGDICDQCNNAMDEHAESTSQ